MAAVNPAGSDTLPAGRKSTSATEAHSRMHGRVLDVWENVKAHNAQGDDGDDTDALEAAFAAASGTRLFLPPGVYVTSRELVIDGFGSSIEGVGAGGNGITDATIIKAKAGSGIRSILRISGRHVSYKDIQLDGNGTAERGILFHDAGRSKFYNPTVINTTVRAIDFDITPSGLSTGNNNSIKVYSPIVTSNDGDGLGSPDFQSDNNAVDIFAPTVTSNGGIGLTLAGGFHIWGGHIEGNTGYGARIGNSTDVTTTVGVVMDWTHLEGNAGGGILVEKATRCVYMRPLVTGQSIDWANSATPAGMTEVTMVGTSGGMRVAAAAEERWTQVTPGGMEVGSTGDSNRDITLTTLGTGRVITTAGAKVTGDVELDGDLNHDGSEVGFYGTAPIAKQTGVAVTAQGIHDALVALGLISA